MSWIWPPRGHCHWGSWQRSQTMACCGCQQTSGPGPWAPEPHCSGHTCCQPGSVGCHWPGGAACTPLSRRAGCGSWQCLSCRTRTPRRARSCSSAAPCSSWSAPGPRCPTAGSANTHRDRDNGECSSGRVTQVTCSERSYTITEIYSSELMTSTSWCWRQLLDSHNSRSITCQSCSQVRPGGMRETTNSWKFIGACIFKDFYKNKSWSLSNSTFIWKLNKCYFPIQPSADTNFVVSKNNLIFPKILLLAWC